MRPSEPGRESWPGFGWAPIHFTVLRQRRDPFGIFGHFGCSSSGLTIRAEPRASATRYHGQPARRLQRAVRPRIVLSGFRATCRRPARPPQVVHPRVVPRRESAWRVEWSQGFERRMCPRAGMAPRPPLRIWNSEGLWCEERVSPGPGRCRRRGPWIHKVSATTRPQREASGDTRRFSHLPGRGAPR